MSLFIFLYAARDLSPKTKTLPVITISADNGDETVRQQAFASGATTHLSKPIDPELLIRTLSQIVQSSIEGSFSDSSTINEPEWPVIEGIDGDISKRMMMGDLDYFHDQLRCFDKMLSLASDELRLRPIAIHYPFKESNPNVFALYAKHSAKTHFDHPIAARKLSQRYPNKKGPTG